MNAPVTLPDIGTSAISQSTRDKLPLHVAVFLANGTILSDETFKLVNFSGQESISNPFELHLELHANTDQPPQSGDYAFRFEDILGRPVTIGLNTPGAGPNDFARAVRGGSEENLSLWNGIAGDFAMGVPGVYHLTVRPALWKLSLTNRYYIHRQMSIRDVIESVLGAHGIVGATPNATRNCVNLNAISGADNPAVTRVQDWLQAGESDLEFLQRLLGKAFIYFYFEHHATHHRVIFANRAAYPPALPDGRTLRYTDTSIDPLGLDQDDLITEYQYSQSMTSTSVNGVFARQQAAWEQDTVATFNTYRAQSATQPGDLPFHRFQVFQYGGSDGETRWDTETCDQARSTAATSLSGGSTCPLLRPGYTMTLSGAVNAGNPKLVRPSLDNRQFVLNSVKHQAELDGVYKAQFQATESYGQVAPFSVHDTQQGWVLAEVVKHDNGEYPKDWRYYQRNAFDPETDKLRDSAGNPKMLRPKGVYVRFATAAPDSEPVWVKLSQSMTTAPELGVTVLVSRANDFSELPEIQNAVESNGHKTVTPSGWTASTSVGSNYSTSYGDSCSVRFGLNSPGNLPPSKSWVDSKYQQGNSGVPGWFSGVHFRDVSWSQGNSSSYSTAEKGRSDVLGESVSIGCNYSQQDAYESKSISVVDHSWSQSTSISTYSENTISGTSESHSTVGVSNSTSETGVSNGSSLTGVSDSASTTGLSNSVGATGISNSASATGISNSINSTGIQTGMSATGMSTNLSLTGLSESTSLTGMTTSTNITGMSTGTSVTGMSESTSLTGLSNSTNLTGLSDSTNLTGLSTSTNLTGSSSSTNLTGASDSINITGSSTSMNVTGSSDSLNVTGSSMDLSVIGSSTRLSATGDVTDISVLGGGIQVTEAITPIQTKATGIYAEIVSGLKALI